MGGVSSGGSFGLKLIKEMDGQIKGAFSEVLAMDPDNEDDTDVRGMALRLQVDGGAGKGRLRAFSCGYWLPS